MKHQIKQLNRQAGRIKAQIMAKLLSLPDNPRIHRMSSNCFVMQSSDLGPNWTPCYHDFKQTYRLIFGQLKTKQPKQILEFLTKVSKEGKFRINSHWTQRVHPDVMEYIAGLLA